MRRKVKTHWPLIIGLVIIAGIDLSTFTATGRSFFGWPNGSTWSNAIEQAEGAYFIFLIMHYGRDRVGRTFVTWWDSHSPAHVIAKTLHEAVHDLHVRMNDIQEIAADTYVAANGGTPHPKAPPREGM